MDTSTILAIVISFISGTLITFFVMLILYKKEAKPSEILHFARTGLNSLDTLTESLKLILPENKTVFLVDKIIDYSIIAVEKAEQLYKANVIAADERKYEAEDFLQKSLELSGINVTEQIKIIAEGCIEAAVHELKNKAN